MTWLGLDEIALGGKRVLVRVDINVPMQDGEVTDDTRIARIKPTIDAIFAAGGRPILLAHFGRPKGKNIPEMSLRAVVPDLERILGKSVLFVAETVGPAAETAIAVAQSNQVVLLENTRFHPEEEANDPDFAKALAALGDIYCNDAFSAAHRAHASTEGIARHLPSCAGRLMDAELKALDAALSTPKRPVCAVVGGAKVSSKLDLLGNLVSKTDHLIIGGGMANTFLVAQGLEIGTSLAEREMQDTARDIVAKAKSAGCEIHLPLDIVVSWTFKAHAEHATHDASACPSDAMILDAGPKTVAHIKTVFDRSATLIWNGPLGAFELEPFNAATNAAAQYAAKLSSKGTLLSVAGGGDTVAALNAADAADAFSYVSAAGGAFLEWMEGKTLPGVAALSNR